MSAWLSRLLAAAFVLVGLCGPTLAAIDNQARGLAAIGLGAPAPSNGIIVDGFAGNDANPGTIAAPIRTIAQCHTLESALTVKTPCYLRGNTGQNYVLTSNPWANSSGETYQTYPPDPKATITASGVGDLGCSNCSFLTIKNLNLVSASNATARMFYFGPTSNSMAPSVHTHDIYLLGDTFNVTASIAVQFYNTDNIYIQGNTFNGGASVNADQVSIVNNDGNPRYGVFVTDNLFPACDRFCVEMTQQNFLLASVENSHFDRNVFKNFNLQSPSASYGALSVGSNYGPAAAAGASGTTSASYGYGLPGNNTVIGNEFDLPSGVNTTPSLGIEVFLQGATYAGNVFNSVGYPMAIAPCGGCVIEFNYINFDTSMSTYQGFSQDGGYNTATGSGEWIGLNTYTDANGMHQVRGCMGADTYGLVGGSGGTAGTYTQVPLTGGSGQKLTATVVVAGGAVTSVTATDIPSTPYVTNDTVSAASATIGGVTGFSVKIGGVISGSSDAPARCGLGYNGYGTTKPAVYPQSPRYVPSMF